MTTGSFSGFPWREWIRGLRLSFIWRGSGGEEKRGKTIKRWRRSRSFFCRGGDKGAGALEFQPLHQQNISQPDADPIRTGPQLQARRIKNPDITRLPQQVPVGVVGGGAGEQPGHITTRHVPGGRALSPAAHHGLIVQLDRDGTLATLPDILCRSGIDFEHDAPICSFPERDLPPSWRDVV